MAEHVLTPEERTGTRVELPADLDPEHPSTVPLDVLTRAIREQSLVYGGVAWSPQRWAESLVDASDDVQRSARAAIPLEYEAALYRLVGTALAAARELRPWARGQPPGDVWYEANL